MRNTSRNENGEQEQGVDSLKHGPAQRLCGGSLLALAVLFVLAGPGVAASRPSVSKARKQPAYDAGTVLVRFRAGTVRSERAAAAAQHGGNLDGSIRGTDFTIVRVEHGSVEQLIGRFRNDKRVADVVPNFIRHAQEDPNDASFWVREQPFETVRLPQAWSTTHGSSAVKIAIVDTGVDLDQPDLATRILPGRDFVNGDDSADDDFGHGTMVAGIAAADANNGFGIAGAAWVASIIPVKVLDATAQGTDAEVAAGISWAADAGASIINLSLGGAADSPVLKQAVDYALAKDALVVAAAGNAGSSVPSYPAAYPGVLAVASTDDAGESSTFSNHGPLVDLAAPGESIFSTARANDGLAAFASGSGTSFASPLVAGIAALVRAVNPAWTHAQVAQRLEATARDMGPPGIDDSYGFGLADAAAALGAPRQPALRPPRDSLEPNGTPDEAKPIGSGATGTISPENDVDWFYFDVTTPGTWPTFTITPPEDPTFDPILEAYTPDLHRLATVDRGGGGSGEQLVIPANVSGRYYVRVSNYQGSRTTTALSSRSEFKKPDYSLDVSQGSAPSERFAPAEVYASGLTGPDGRMETWPQWADIGDLTGDGRNDALLSTNAYIDPTNDNKVFLFPQLADGSLDRATRIDPGCRGPVGETGDMNGDGATDLVVGCGDAGMRIYFQDHGTLGPPLTLPTPRASSFQIVDINGDGRQDILAPTLDGITLALNTGVGFTTQIVSPLRARTRAGDVTGDGRPDVVAVDFTAPNVYVFAQNADGSFAAPTTYVAPGSPFSTGSLAVGDVTGDGRADVALTIEANSPNAAVDILAQTASGTLGPAISYPVYDNPQALAVADIDGDGRKDLVMAHGGWSAVGVLVQSAGSGFAPEELYGVGYASNYPDVSVGDVNGDGAPDLAVPNYNYGLVVLRQYSRNLSPAEQVWVRSTAPDDFAAGVATTAAPMIRFARALDASSVTASTVSLLNGDTGASVSASVLYDPATRTVTVRPVAALATTTPYRLTVSGVKDTAGNVMTEAFSVRFTTVSAADVYPPETTIWNGSDGQVSSSTLIFAFVSEDPAATFSCSLNGSAFAACSPWTPYDVTPGTYTFQVRAKDAAGNVDPTPARKRVVITAVGQNPPDTWLVYPWPYGNVAGTSATFTLGSDQGGGFECSLDGAAYTACPSTITYTGLSPGVHTFSARSLYNGMIDLTPLAVAWTVVVTDTTPPETTLDSGPTGTVASSSASFVFSSSEAGSRFECSLDAQTSTACSSPATFTNLADGQHTFRVRAIDGGGNADPSPATRIWTVDTTPPDTSINSGPAGALATGVASFAFSSGEADARFECALDTAAFAACLSPTSLNGLADGGHTFRVRAIDTVGNADATPASRSWTVDTTPPETTISSGPEDPSPSSSATFVFDSGEGGSRFECSLDTAAFASCTSPAAYSGLGEAQHAFRVRAIDGVGNVDPTPASYGWLIKLDDHTPPNVSLTSPVSGALVRGAITLAADANDNGALDRVVFAVNGAPVGSDSTPPFQIEWETRSIGDGTATVSATAFDDAGNDAAASVPITVDNTAPETELLSSPPPLTNDRAAGFTFAAGEPSRFECSFDGSTFATCGSPTTYAALADGSHTFRVRAIDAAGNVDPTPAALSWTIDTTAPDTALLTAPVSLTNARSASFSFAAVEGVRFECALDHASFTSCVPPVTYTSLPEGRHDFAVRAIDAAGNVDQTPAAATWTIDVTPPETTITAGPVGTLADANATFAFSAGEPATFECSLDGAAFGACVAPVEYANLQAGAHLFLVRAIDQAGNADPTPASHMWTVGPVSPLQPPPVHCVVPRLRSKTLAAAKGALARSHCRLSGVKRAYSRRVGRGRVLAQTPRAGTILPRRGAVSVVVSRGKPR